MEKRSQAFMMVISVFSPDDRYDQTYLANYTNLYLLDPIKRLPGANLSSMFPVPDIAMRIWLKPDRLAQLGITADDVSTAIQRQNKAYGIGQIGQAPTTKGTQQSFVVTTQGMLTHPKEFDDIILRTDKEGAAIVRLKDVGHAELGGKDYSIASKVNGKRAVAIVVYQQPGANAIETSGEIRKLLKELAPASRPAWNTRWCSIPASSPRPPSKRWSTPSSRPCSWWSWWSSCFCRASGLR